MGNTFLFLTVFQTSEVTKGFPLVIWKREEATGKERMGHHVFFHPWKKQCSEPLPASPEKRFTREVEIR